VFLEHLLEDAVGMAGVLAAVMDHEDCDEHDVAYTTRHLSEHLHAILALWREWRELPPEAAPEGEGLGEEPEA
jgi:hypothetical protein